MRPRVGQAVILLVAAWLCAGSAQAQTAGAIRGNVVDDDYQSPLADVRVTVVGTSLTTRTSESGSFLIDGVPPGTYTLSFALAGYERLLLGDVVVTSGGMVSVRADLVQEVYVMDELVVVGDDFLGDTELGLLEVRAESVTMQDSISSELIKKSGAGTVAGALRRVVGASITDGRYATVRGMSDRYTGTTLHGVRIPSSDPRKRAVQVDLFPTGVVDGVTVTKTFTPDLQGDFTGGGVDIVTKAIPESRILEFGLAREYNTFATGNTDFLSYEGGGAKLFDTGDRDLDPKAKGQFPPFPSFSPNPSEEDMLRSRQYDEITRSFSPVMGVSASEPGPNRKLRLVAGDRFAAGRTVFGILGAITQRRTWTGYAGGENNTGAVSDASQGVALEEREDNLGREALLTGAMLNFAAQPNEDHELSLRLIANHSAEDFARLQIEDLGGEIFEQNQSLRYIERFVGSALVQGRHGFPGSGGRSGDGLSFDWTLAINKTEQNEPDVRYFRNIYDANNFGFRMPANSTDAQNTRRTWRTIEEDDNQFAGNVTRPFAPGWNVPPGYVKAGISLQSSDRSFEQSSFTYTFPQQVGSIFDPARACNQATSEYQAAGPGELWTDVFNDDGRIGLAPEIPQCPFNEDAQASTPAPNQLLWTIIPTGDDVNYTAEQEIPAAYAMTELFATRRLKTIFGARYEGTRMKVVPTNIFGVVDLIEVQCPDPENPYNCNRAIVSVPQKEAIADIDEGHLLPSIGMVYEAAPNMNVRAGWSRTIARPTFRELAPVATEEFLQGDEFVGNPDLVLSEITNYDLRWEWFRKPGEVFAASLFYKNLTNPIEYISFSTNNRSFIQPVNFEVGTVLGVELEARVDFGNYFESVQGLAVGANYTLLDSEVEVPLQEQISLSPYGLDEPTRRLQGQPDHLANFYVTYDNDKSGTGVGLFFADRGEVLDTGSSRGVEDGTPNVFTEGISDVAVTVRQKIGKYLTLAVSAKNITQPTLFRVYRTPDGDEAIKNQVASAARYQVGIGVSW